jgi:hypothetical protein
MGGWINGRMDGWLEYSSDMVEKKGKAVPLQAWSGPEGSKTLRFPDYMTTAQDGGLSAVRTGRLYPRECSWYSFPLEAESTPGP